MDTNFVAEPFDISRRRVRYLAKQYLEHGEIPASETPRASAYAEPSGWPRAPGAACSRDAELWGGCGGAVAMAHALGVTDELIVDSNRAQAHLKEHDPLTENSNKWARQRPWIQLERE